MTSQRGKATSKRARAATPPSPDVIPSIRILLNEQWDRIESRLDLLEETFGQRMRNLEVTINGLKEAAEFQSKEVQEAKGKVDRVEKELSLKEKLLQDEIDKLSAYVARENLIYTGIPEVQNENVKQVLRDLHVEQLQIPVELADKIEYQRVHRLFGNAGARGRPRAIKARFVRYADRVLVQQHAKNLKGTTMYISEDMPKRVREARQPQIAALKAARRVGKLAFFSRADPAKLFIDKVYMPPNQQEAFVREMQGNFERQQGNLERQQGAIRRKLPLTKIPTLSAMAGATAGVTVSATASFTEGATAGALKGDTVVAGDTGAMEL